LDSLNLGCIFEVPLARGTGAWGSPLTSKSTPSNGRLGRARSAVTLVGGRGRGPGRQDSRGTHLTVSQGFAGLAFSIGRQETLVSAVIR